MYFSVPRVNLADLSRLVLHFASNVVDCFVVVVGVGGLGPLTWTVRLEDAHIRVTYCILFTFIWISSKLEIKGRKPLSSRLTLVHHGCAIFAEPILHEVVGIVLIRRLETQLRRVELCRRKVVDGCLPSWSLALLSKAFVFSGFVPRMH